MKSFLHLQRGETPRQVHVDLGGLKEDELGRSGFTGRVATLYHRNDPTRYRATGDYRLRDAHYTALPQSDGLRPGDGEDAAGFPLALLENDDCRLSLSRRREAMPWHYRNVDGDTLYFVHRGTGVFETEFGPLRYEPGDYVVLPKAVTWRLVPDDESGVFLVLETDDELTVPDYGLLGRNVVFDPTLLTIPEPQVIEADDREEWEIVIQHGGQHSSIFYPYHPCDVAGWKGDLFPFKFNLRDWNVILSDTIHLPPTVHQFLGARGVIVCHFLPRPAEMRVGAERLPWYHRNVDFDEVAFYHGGSFLGIPLPAGQIAHSPQGIHHGPPEPAREHSRNTHEHFSTIDWEIIAIDTVRPLRPTEAFKKAAEAKA